MTKWILEMHTHLKILRTRVFSWEGDRGVSKDREKIQKGVIFNLTESKPIKLRICITVNDLETSVKHP